MYETEVNDRLEPCDQIPPEVLSAFAELDGKLLSRSVLPWSEHCTECVWPTCYTSCALYEPRIDLRCRRFIDGMVRVPFPQSPNSYLLKVRFKQWGKLWASGNIRLFPIKRAQRIEFRDYVIGSAIHRLPLPPAMKRVAVAKRYTFKKRTAEISGDGDLPDSFLLECYNPQSDVVPLSLTIRPSSKQVAIPFQALIELSPGFRCVRIPCEQIATFVDLHSRFTVELVPNQIQNGTTLYFGLIDFVRDLHGAQKRSKKVKCVVWDLDNTLWDGILLENGQDGITLRPGISSVIRELDQRGIVNSIASKNNRDQALQVLRDLKLEEYFLYPQISWQPKSQALKAIARELNIGLDCLLFLDDSEFERQEVQAACPGVRVLQPEGFMTLLNMDACHGWATAESRNRRKMYQVESTRKSAAAEFGQDYLAFLRYCQIIVRIRPLTANNLDRVHELTQRTNQMNFSGNRYTRDALEDVLATSYLDTFVLDCEDRFGAYGTVGFCIVNRREPRMIDLMFSCRIQSKHVEHGFLGFIIRKYVTELGRDFLADVRRTEHNAATGRVFADIGMTETNVRNGVSRLVFPRDRVLPDEGLIDIRLDQ